ncbi:hypothetical protein CIB48_g744 [Xylaria polymorpha]|nr:hypothetical protein CIB48_g744 [Xylaria polymorpha]
MAPKSQQTLGVELEFIVFYTAPGKQAPTKDDKRYGPVLKCPNHSEIAPPLGYVPQKHSVYQLEAAWVRQKVADVITSAGFKAKASWRAKGDEPDLFEFWNVVPDISVGLPMDFDQAYSPLKHVGVEINSPVFVAGEDAFKEISTVIEAINSAFRRTVPPVCGFHVHVGRGFEPLELRPVQRTASLLWLAENLIDTLHPGCRHGNRQCLSMRHFSGMSYFMKIEQGTEDNHRHDGSHAKFSMDRVDKNRRKPTNYKFKRPIDVTNDMESTLSRCFASEYFLPFYEPWYDGLPAGVEMMDGARMILSARDTAEIAQMTSFRSRFRGAYNFANMESERRGSMGPRKPTIEFRQAAGSLDSSWIVLWAKICLALNGPAVVESSDDAFFQLLYHCEEGFYSPRKYDVFDLLHDIGLCKEDIDAVHSRLVSGRYEREPGLAFHRPDDTADGALDEGYGPGWQRGVQYDVCPQLTLEDYDLSSNSWDENDSWNDSSLNSTETDESSVGPVMDGVYDLSLHDGECLAEPQRVLECEPTPAN